MINLKPDMNIANKITVVRIVAVPLYVFVIYFNQPWSNIAATVVFTIACLSDFFDGYFARKYNLVTDFGKIADPVADKILITAALICLVGLDRLNVWVPIIMLARDFTVGAVRDLSASKGVIIPAGIWGKLKTTTQMFGVGMITFYDKFLFINWFYLGTVVIYGAVVLSIYSAYVYIRDYQASNG